MSNIPDPGWYYMLKIARIHPAARCSRAVSLADVHYVDVGHDTKPHCGLAAGDCYESGGSEARVLHCEYEQMNATTETIGSSIPGLR